MIKSTVLVVDDSLDDLDLVKMAVKQIGWSIDLRIAHGGQKALDYLSEAAAGDKPEAYPIPTLILLDLKMPRVNGFQVLAEFRKMTIATKPFVVIMSASRLAEDIAKARSLGATVFHSKPASFKELCAMLEKIFGFFCKIEDSQAPKMGYGVVQ